MEVKVLPAWTWSRSLAGYGATALHTPRAQPQLPVPFSGCDLPVSPLRAPQAFLERLAHPDCP